MILDFYVLSEMCCPHILLRSFAYVCVCVCVCGVSTQEDNEWESNDNLHVGILTGD